MLKSQRPTPNMTDKEIIAFQQFIRRWYQTHGRFELPWRQVTNPYNVLVSELMLQQTQVERVIPKYQAFIKHFPDVEKLAAAPLSAILKLWQGLGYNRRAKYLHQAAQTVMQNFAGKFPAEMAQLQKLPGIGPYTAAAICNFAFNYPEPLIETNVRTVFLYHFFPQTHAVPDSHIMPIIAQTIDIHHPREWFWALMDYGSYLKKTIGNPNKRSKQYNTQSRFSGSLRQVRGEIIRLLTQHEYLTESAATSKIQGNSSHISEAISQLLAEGLIVKSSNQLQLAE